MEANDEKYLQFRAYQLSMDDFRLNIYYNDPSPLNYIKLLIIIHGQVDWIKKDY